MRFLNPNIEYYSNKSELAQRKVFHCAEQMQKYIKGNIIDLGTGTGTVIDFFAKKIKSKSITCVDVSDYHKKILEKKYKFKKINFDIGPYDLKSDTYNTIISSDVIEHVLSPFMYLSESYRILKKNGVIVISTPDAKKTKVTVPHINYFTPESLKLLLKRVGFKKIIRIYNGIINKEVTNLISKIPLVRNLLNNGCYYIAIK